MAPWLALVLTAAPEQATFLFALENVPVGVVTLTADEARYTYRSEHLFTRGSRRSRLTRQVTYSDPQTRRIPESLWLWRRPAPGCVPLVEELSDRTGEGCAQKSEGNQVTGIVLGERFEARYENERLAELTVGPARFTRVAVAPRLASPPDLYGGSFAIEEGAGTGGALAVSPPVEVDRVVLPPWDLPAARALAERVHDSFTGVEPTPADWRLNDDDEVGGCLAHARRFREWARRSGHAAALVFGLLVDDGRAYPHAWVRVGGSGGSTADLDPTTLDEVKPTTHLALAATAGEPGPEVGKRYLELANGARRVLRQP